MSSYKEKMLHFYNEDDQMIEYLLHTMSRVNNANNGKH